MELIGIVGTVLAVAGVVLNNRMRIECFCLWIVSNGIFFALHLHAGMWSLAVRDIVFMALAAHGWIMWKNKRAKIKMQKGKLCKSLK
jgi:nicotinamide riboside transporter PnuC